MNRGVSLLLVGVLLVATVGAVVVFDRPTVEGTQSRFTGVNQSTTLVTTHLHVSNPSPVSARLGSATMSYAVAMNDIRMGGGSKHGLRIDEGATAVNFTTAIDNRKIPAWWVSHIENGERTRINTTEHLTVPVLGRVATVHETRTTTTHITDRLNSSRPRPVNASLPLVPDPVFVVNRTSATWGNVTTERTPLETAITIDNPHAIPIPITRLEYTITMNGVTVGNGTTGRGYTIPADGHRTLQTESVIENDRLDDWWVTHIKRNQHTDLRIAFTAVVTLPGNDTVRVPLTGLGYNTTLDTESSGRRTPPVARIEPCCERNPSNRSLKPRSRTRRSRRTLSTPHDTGVRLRLPNRASTRSASRKTPSLPGPCLIRALGLCQYEWCNRYARPT